MNYLSDIFKLVDNEILKHSEAVSIAVYQENRAMEIVAKCVKMVRKDSARNLEKQILDAYNLKDVSLEFVYDREIFNASSIKTVAGYLTDYPQIVPILNNAECKLDGDTLYIDGLDGGIIDEEIKTLLTEAVKRMFDIDIKIEFICTKTEEEIEEQFEQDKKEIIESIEKARVALEGSKKKSPVIYGREIKGTPDISIADIDELSGNVIIDGYLFKKAPDIKETRNGAHIVTFSITDDIGAINCKIFTDDNAAFEALEGRLKKGTALRVRGQAQNDKYARELLINVRDINVIEWEKRTDDAEEKRVELHMHTKMSTMDAMTDAEVLVEQAIKWGHKAVAITDHGDVQAFPEAYHASNWGKDIKILYGVECYLVNDSANAVVNPTDKNLDSEFVVFDIETTGLSPATETITEIGAVKIKDGRVIDSFNKFVNPGKPIPQKIVELTGITDAMVENAPPISVILPEFYDFIGDSALVAHNAGFDTSFIKKAAKDNGLRFDFCYIDTLELSRSLVKGVKNYKLDTLTKHFNVKLENHHRACDDAAATAQVFIKLLEMLKEKEVLKICDINNALEGDTDIKSLKTYHAIILVQTQEGMKNLYKIVSASHLDYFYRRPRVPKSLIQKYRKGLLIGSACEAGELYQEILKNPYDFDRDEVNKIIDFYDYLEIQPLGNNSFMLRENIVENEGTLKHINRTIIDLGKEKEKLTVATCDVHFMNEHDSIYRAILQAGQGFADADNQAPLYFRTTDEMLDEFSYLGDELAHEVVVTNTNKIADMIDNLKPVPDEKAPPEIPGSDDELRKLTYAKAKSIYGDDLPEIVKERVDIELDSIISNGYSVLYIIAQKLVKKSNDDGYLVGSRGSVGSSLVAFMSGITEVNSLPPHYVCPKCKHNEFFADGSVGCGFDLPDKNCPDCGEPMIKDGHDIPFQTFLGFKGDKEPDIDLNFSGEYQPVAHKYVEELFGEGHVFRAGTIGTVAEKTAYGFVKKYYDEKNEIPTNAQIDRLVAGCTGVKRTTGQHPGGIIVVPKKNDVHEFSPIQHPADDMNTDIVTLHFDYHSIDQNLLKLDILGHDDPTAIRMLEDLTGIDAKKIPLDDKATMSLFTGTEALGVTPEEIGSTVGTFGVPEFGTKFVRQMLVDTKPTTFTELVRISGLSHGTDVWLNNAQTLIQEGTTTLSQAICTRDDIMVYLIYCGVEKSLSFKIMESVRKGKGLTPDFETAMREQNVPEWYIDSCKKIKYMFPKAHAVAYVTMAFRIAWFKVNKPKEYYATFFSVRADDFDIEIMATEGLAKQHRKMIEDLGNDANVKQKGVLTILELVCEMFARGIKFLPIDLYESDSTKFRVIGDNLLPPLNSIPGLGENAAKALVSAREEEAFCSIDDLRARGKVSKTIIDKMKDMGILEGLPESSQIEFSF